MPRYQRVRWEHQFEDEPVVLYSEISDDGVETRKVDQYRDGRLHFADATRSTGITYLSEKKMPSIAEIAKQHEFHPADITKDTFEEVWQRAVAAT